MIVRGELEAAERSLMLVGHLPHLSRLVTLLIRREAQSETVDFAPATMVCCSFEGSAWKISSTIGPDSD
jgi:phosphohistidine phosphatase SixA